VIRDAEVIALRSVGGRFAGAEVRVDGDVLQVDARFVVNAAGPWVDRVRQLEDARAGTSVRLSRGSHVLVPGGEEWRAALTIAQDDVRVTFAVPWYDMLLLGTTDVPYEGDPGDLGLETIEVGQILDEASLALETPFLSPSHVRAAYTGLRVLPTGDGGTATARRETVITRSAGGMLNVAGGKLTTYRRIALEALTRLRSDLGIHRIDSRPWPLPGAASSSRPDLEGVDPQVRAHLEHLYGSLAGEVLAPAHDDPALLERLHPAGPDIAAQVRYAVAHEWARTEEDVLRRRTTLFYRGLADDATAARVATLLSG
jgi:glycerol-3-phosphate dehydrogenase